MAKQTQNKNTAGACKPLNAMTRQEREQAIEELERARLAKINEIETIMGQLAYMTGKKKLKKRRWKLGTAPNDFKKTNY